VPVGERLLLGTIRGVRVVADPAALDAARWTGTDPLILRFAPDEAFAIGLTEVTVDDPHAIVVPETGFVGAWLTRDELLGQVVPHVEWPLPATRPALAQGAIAGVPAKLWLDDDRALLVTLAAYRDELEGRLR
jgi:hypothetical protein